MSAVLLRTPSLRPVFAIPAAATCAVLFTIVFVAWQGFAHVSAPGDEVSLIELTHEFAPPPPPSASPARPSAANAPQPIATPRARPTEVEAPEAQIRGSRSLSVPDVVPSQIPPPVAVAFKASDFTGAGVQGGAAAAPVIGSAPTFAPRVESSAAPLAPAAPPPPSVASRRYGRGVGGESYAHVHENPFLPARTDPLSTFAIDVDRASYANVRRFLNAGQLPPPDAVRIEELINYFPYEYAGPEGREPFAVHTEVTRAPWAPTHRLVRIGIQGRSVPARRMPPANLVFLIDVSGSMQPENKLPLLKSAFRLLVGELREQDIVSIVVYAGAAGLVLEPTSGADKRTILAALERLEAGGSTAGGAGLELAYQVARRHRIEGGNNRVILATDGDFNVGPSSDEAMVRLIEEKRAQGTFLTVLGFGVGNLKDSKMEQLADHGNGSFAYVDDLPEARKVMVNELAGTLLTIAKDVKVQVEFNPAQVKSWRLLGYENRVMPAEDFANDRKDGGELGAGHTVTALYEVEPTGAAADRGSGPLRYQERPAAGENGRDGELLYVKLRYKDPDGDESRLLSHPVPDRVRPASTDLRFAAAVAAFGMVLRDSEYCGDFRMSDVLDLASGGVGDDREGYRREFVRLVERASELGDRYR